MGDHEGRVHLLDTRHQEVTISIGDDGSCNSGCYMGVFEGEPHTDMILCMGRLDYSRLGWSCSETMRFATGSWDGTIKVWSVDRMKCVQTLHHQDIVWSVSEMSDGSLLCGYNDKKVGIWEINKLRKGLALQSTSHNECNLSFAETEIVLSGHCSMVLNAIELKTQSMRGWIASCSGDSTIRLWDRVTLSCIRILKGHREEVYSIIEVEEDGVIVSVSADRTIKVWKIQSSDRVDNVFSVDTSRVIRKLDFTTDGLLLCGTDVTLTVSVMETWLR